MVTQFLVPVRDCCSIDERRLSEAGGRLLRIGCLEDDGTVKIDVDINSDDRDANRRVSTLFAGHFEN